MNPPYDAVESIEVTDVADLDLADIRKRAWPPISQSRLGRFVGKDQAQISHYEAKPETIPVHTWIKMLNGMGYRVHVSYDPDRVEIDPPRSVVPHPVDIRVTDRMPRHARLRIYRAKQLRIAEDKLEEWKEYAAFRWINDDRTLRLLLPLGSGCGDLSAHTVMDSMEFCEYLHYLTGAKCIVGEPEIMELRRRIKVFLPGMLLNALPVPSVDTDWAAVAAEVEAIAEKQPEFVETIVGKRGMNTVRHARRVQFYRLNADPFRELIVTHHRLWWVYTERYVGVSHPTQPT